MTTDAMNELKEELTYSLSVWATPIAGRGSLLIVCICYTALGASAEQRQVTGPVSRVSRDIIAIWQLFWQALKIECLGMERSLRLLHNDVAQ